MRRAENNSVCRDTNQQVQRIKRKNNNNLQKGGSLFSIPPLLYMFIDEFLWSYIISKDSIYCFEFLMQPVVYVKN
jgi:hypothetical protein